MFTAQIVFNPRPPNLLPVVVEVREGLVSHPNGSLHTSAENVRAKLHEAVDVLVEGLIHRGKYYALPSSDSDTPGEVDG